MSTSVPTLPPVGLLYGAFYFAVVICTAFYGITCMQTFFYYVHYQNDPVRTKSFVAVLWALNTIHEALSISGVYKYIMNGLVTPSGSFPVGNPELVLQLLCTALVGVLSEGFFVYRIYVLSRKNIITPIVWVILATLRLTFGIVYVGKALYTADGSVQALNLAILSDNTFMTLLTLSLSFAAGVDILIAIFLTLLLVRKRTTTRFARTAHMLQRLTVFAVNTGIWTALFALLTIVFLHVFPTNALYLVPGFPLGSLYCNTLLANLNARSYISGGETNSNVIDMDLFANSSSQVSESTTAAEQRGVAKLVSSSQPGIWKTTEVLTFSDTSRSMTSAEVAVV